MGEWPAARGRGHGTLPASPAAAGATPPIGPRPPPWRRCHGDAGSESKATPPGEGGRCQGDADSGLGPGAAAVWRLPAGRRRAQSPTGVPVSLLVRSGPHLQAGLSTATVRAAVLHAGPSPGAARGNRLRPRPALIRRNGQGLTRREVSGVPVSRAAGGGRAGSLWRGGDGGTGRGVSVLLGTGLTGRRPARIQHGGRAASAGALPHFRSAPCPVSGWPLSPLPARPLATERSDAGGERDAGPVRARPGLL